MYYIIIKSSVEERIDGEKKNRRRNIKIRIESQSLLR